MIRQDMIDSSFKIPVPPEFRFSACLDYLSRSDREVLFEVADGKITRLLDIKGAQLLIEIGSIDDKQLQVNLLHGRIESRETKQLLLQYIRDWFDLDRDLKPFYTLAERTQLLEDLPSHFYGLRLMGIPDLFEALIWAIVGQQVNLPFAYTLKQRITEAYGDSLEWNGRVYYLFPRPEQLANATLDELYSLQLTKMKAATILEVSRIMASGGLGDAAEQELLQIRGIGPWTSNYVRMRCLRDPRALPAGDVALQNAVKARLKLESKPTPQELKAIFAEVSGWEAYSTFYLWRSLSLQN